MAKKRSESPLFEPQGSLDATDEFAPSMSATDAAPIATTYHEIPSNVKATSTPSASDLIAAKPSLHTSKKRKALHNSLDVAAYLADLESKIDRGVAWDEIKPYDSSLEELPLAKVSVLRPGFAKAEALITQDVVQYMLNAICRLKIAKPSAELSYMEQRTKKLLVPSYRPPVIIGVRGPAGAGKTSLINAILSTDGLAHTSSGSVGTYVPVEYLPLGQQLAPYAFEIKPFSFDDSQKCIRTHWKDYFKERLSEDKEAMDDTDTVDLVKPARDAFLALFADVPEFENENKAEAFMGLAESLDDARVLPKLLDWGRERYDKLSIILNRQPFFAHTVSDLSELMEPFVQTAVSPVYEGSEDVGLESSVWPFVKLGRVAFEDPLLNAGLVLADLPGTNDCNIHRVRLTEDYIKKCRITLVVHEIKRGGDKEEIKQSILEAWRRRREDSVTLVLTHTDEIGDESSCKAPLDPEEDFAMTCLKAHKSTIDQKMKRVNTQLRSPQNKRNTKLRTDLSDEKERYEIHIKHVDLLRKQSLIEARNRQVKAELRTWFRDKTNLKEPLSIFCVSTKDYLELLREDENRSIAQPSPSAASTQIVQLRRHLFTMVNKRGQEQSMVNYYRLVKHLLNEMSLACTGFKPMYKRDHLLKFIRDAHESFPEVFRRRRLEFLKWLQPVLDAFNSSIDKWIRKAEGKCDLWGNFNAVSYWTFLKREGVHKKPHGKKQNWNRTLLDHAAEDLEPPLTSLCNTGCSAFVTDLIRAIHETMDEMEHNLKFHLDPLQIKTFREFFENLQLQTKDAELQVRAVVRKLKDGFLKLSHEVVSLEPKNSPFRRHMKAAYAAVTQAHPPKTKKSNVHNSRKTAFKAAVTCKTSGPYGAIKTHIETEAAALLQDAEAELKTRCDDLFVKIFCNFDHICPKQEDDGLKALERGKELRKDIDEARRVLEGPAREALLSAGIKVN